jgi:hypothetical protein
MRSFGGAVVAEAVVLVDLYDMAVEGGRSD